MLPTGAGGNISRASSLSGEPRCTDLLTEISPSKVGSNTRTRCLPRKAFSAVFLFF